MPLNPKKLSVCLGVVAGLAAPFFTGSVTSIAAFPEAQYYARKVYSIRTSAAAAEQTTEQLYSRYLESCQMTFQRDCELAREMLNAGPNVIWGGSPPYCPSRDEAFSSCLREWQRLPPSNSPLAYLAGWFGAADRLWPLARDFLFFFGLAAGGVLAFGPFIRWLRT
jgi:hypothetical protein